MDSNAGDKQLLQLVDGDLVPEPGNLEQEVLPLAAPSAVMSRLHSVAFHVLQGGGLPVLFFCVALCVCVCVGVFLLLGAPAAAHVDISRQYRVDNDVLVSFDNAVHSSGHQRAYTRCCGKMHEACFKYTVIHRHPSEAIEKNEVNTYLWISTPYLYLFMHWHVNEAHAVAWCAVWARAARGAPANFTKEVHKKFVPSDEAVAALTDKIVGLDGS